jgi:uncharacterized protein YcbK (DUF882 family)
MKEFKYFKLDEFKCSHTGENKIQKSFVHQLDHLRAACGFSFVVTSGYRDASHPVERIKKSPGTGRHCQGIAADIAVSDGLQRAQICKHALALGFSVGPSKTFVHVDARDSLQVLFVY